MVQRSIETMFDLRAGNYCGVLMRKRLMKRVLKLQQEYEFKLQQLLASNLDEIQTSNWTINENWKEKGKKQITGYYFDPNESDKAKLERVKLFALAKAEKVDLLFEAESYKGVREILNEYANEGVS